jgi:flagellar hook assembly protein FlgD
LERRSWNAPTLERSNWGSASASENFATPGYKNSQATPTGENQGVFYLVSKVMSPDGDGFEDALTFGWNFEMRDMVLNAYIYDLGGRMIQQVLNNFTIPASGQHSWDGVMKNGSKIPIGNYILYLSGFNLNGQAIEKKLAFGVYQAW